VTAVTRFIDSAIVRYI